MPAIDYLNRGPGTTVISRSVPFEEIASPEVLRLQAYVEKTRGDRVYMSKADLDPAQIKPLLPLLALMEITSPPLRVFYRLFGTSLVALYGELTGTYLHERVNHPQLRDEALGKYAQLIVEKRPIYGITELVVGENRHRTFEWAFFPLSSDGTTITHALYIEQRSRAKPRF
jgi:hypothetical protein